MWQLLVNVAHFLSEVILALGGTGVCLLGVVCNWTSVLQEPQRPTRLSRGSRGARGDDVVECLEMECVGQFSTPER